MYSMPDLCGASDGDSSRSFSCQELAAMSIVRLVTGLESMARPEVNGKLNFVLSVYVCMCMYAFIYLSMYVCMDIFVTITVC